MSFLKDLYTFLWDILYQASMPVRGIIIVIITAVLIIILSKKLFPIIIKVFIYLIMKLIMLITVTNYFLFIKRNNNITLELFLKLDDKFHGMMESLKQILDSSKSSFGILEKQKKFFTKVIVFTSIILALWILIPSTGLLLGTRIDKYSYAAINAYQRLEFRLTEGLGIYPAKTTLTSSKSYKYFKLNEKGYKGAVIRKQPNLIDQKRIAVVEGNIKLQYLEEQFVDDEGRVWYKVKTEKGKIGWISSRLVEVIE